MKWYWWAIIIVVIIALIYYFAVYKKNPANMAAGSACSVINADGTTSPGKVANGVCVKN